MPIASTRGLGPASFGPTANPDDPDPFLVLDRTAADFAGGPGFTLANALADPTALSTSFSLEGFGRFVITARVTVVAGAGTLYVAARQGPSTADPAVPADWSYFTLPDPDRTTGEVTVQLYQALAPLTAPDQRSLSFLKWATLGSVVVWADVVGMRGTIEVQRFSTT